MKSVNQFIKSMIIVSGMLVVSCDVDNILKDDNGDEIPLILADINFTDSKIHVNLLDLDTEIPIEERMNVEVYANKKIINLKGEYKNQFSISDGTLTFSVDPNEIISEEDPLELKIDASNNKLLSTNAHYEIKSKGDHFENLFIYREEEFETFLEEFLDLLFLRSTNEYNILKDGTDIDAEWDPDSQNIVLSSHASRLLLNNYEKIVYHKTGTTPLTNLLQTLDKEGMTPTGAVHYGFSSIYPTSSISISYEKISSDVVSTQSKLFVSYTINEYDQKEVITQTLSSNNELYEYRSVTTDDYHYETSETDLGSGTEIVIPAGARINYLCVGEASLDYNICTVGSTVNIEMPTNAEGTTVKYKLTNNDILKASETVSVSAGMNSFNTGSFTFEDSQPNILTIEDTDQYDFEPNSISLESCPQTYNFVATPQSDLNLYNINAKFSCSGLQIAVMPTILAKIKRKDAPETEWEYFNFKAGSISLYLLPDEEYIIKGDYDEEEFYFEFTTTFDDDTIDQLVSDTIAVNNGIESVQYEYSEDNLETNIAITVTLKENSCTFSE